MKFTYRILRRPWRAKTPLYWSMLPELAGIIPLLILFTLLPRRKEFWSIGYEYRLNSNPAVVIFAMVNNQDPPKIPFVWSEASRNYNVAISILSLFVLLVKMIAIIMKVYYPLFGTIVGLSLTVVYAIGIYGQAGPDYLDDRYPSPSPWYLRKSCELGRRFGKYDECIMARGALACTVFLLTVYLLQTAFAIWAMIPDKKLDEPRDPEDDLDDDESLFAISIRWEREKKRRRAAKGIDVEMTPTGQSSEEQKQGEEQQQQQGEQLPPFTPRTQAFHKLSRYA